MTMLEYLEELGREISTEAQVNCWEGQDDFIELGGDVRSKGFLTHKF